MSTNLTGSQSLTERTSNPSRQKAVDCEVAVIGAGPYGLSAAVHLKASGESVRVFGEPMAFWAQKMPEGMLLRSPRVASNISDPTHTFTLESYETAFGKPPSAPVPLGTFVDYGKWFCKHFSEDLDRRNVARIGREGQRFVVVLEDGEKVRVRRVIVAAGIGPFKHKPDVFKHMHGGIRVRLT